MMSHNKKHEAREVGSQSELCFTLVAVWIIIKSGVGVAGRKEERQ